MALLLRLYSTVKIAAKITAFPYFHSYRELSTIVLCGTKENQWYGILLRMYFLTEPLPKIPEILVGRKPLPRALYPTVNPALTC